MGYWLGTHWVSMLCAGGLFPTHAHPWWLSGCHTHPLSTLFERSLPRADGIEIMVDSINDPKVGTVFDPNSLINALINLIFHSVEEAMTNFNSSEKES
ncbi:hypothetical protein MA16_Dca007153 [Dendrobium catenatum]|uniref:Uncharacterized protein n=1 Tax=Dendrobium catenatum TaxID=906689 RepID=A0A2I0W412_9ASPA|nr:hypothetical protein MA16_Dca007153 [Dendrobium catenatum]